MIGSVVWVSDVGGGGFGGWLFCDVWGVVCGVVVSLFVVCCWMCGSVVWLCRLEGCVLVEIGFYVGKVWYGCGRGWRCEILGRVVGRLGMEWLCVLLWRFFLWRSLLLLLLWGDYVMGWWCFLLVLDFLGCSMWFVVCYLIKKEFVYNKKDIMVLFLMELCVGNKYCFGWKIGSGFFGEIYLGEFRF